MCVRAESVGEHIRLLRRWGYLLATFGGLAAAVAAGDGAGIAALTFDDGFAGTLDRLLPVLLAEDAPATVFVVTGWLGGVHPDAPWARILSGRDLRVLHASGVEIGSHTVSHPDLSALGEAAAERELRESKLALEEILDAEVDVAAYPRGLASAETRRACRAAGYRAGCRFRGGGTWSDPFDLPRQPVGSTTSAFALRLKRDDRYERVFENRVARAARRGAWHTVSGCAALVSGRR
jgi:peptidoglycan/xylan/chitin deacetylase (PgdA/CDA1 family)